MNDITKQRILGAIYRAEAENQRLEFKKRIELRTAAGKAEFIRDAIALANSANESPREPGYIVVGVKKGKVFDISSEQYDGATFREIIRAQVTPELGLNYYELNVTRRGRIGVIEFVPDSEAIYLARKDVLSETGEKLMAPGTELETYRRSESKSIWR
jgi:hypothetical protein